MHTISIGWKHTIFYSEVEKSFVLFRGFVGFEMQKMRTKLWYQNVFYIKKIQSSSLCYHILFLSLKYQRNFNPFKQFYFWIVQSNFNIPETNCINVKRKIHFRSIDLSNGRIFFGEIKYKIHSTSPSCSINVGIIR